MRRFATYRAILSCLLILILTIQVLDKTFIYFVYKINIKEIIENYCINRDKPELECDGKCYLKKQLEKQEESHQKTPYTTKNFEDTVLGNTAHKAVIPPIYFCTIAFTYPPNKQGLLLGITMPVFHPPNPIAHLV